MAVFAAVITPSPDAPTMMLLWIPMCMLYEAGIWLCKLQPKSLSEEMDQSELDEMLVLGRKGISDLIAAQRAVLARIMVSPPES